MRRKFELWENRWLYLMALPALMIIFVFAYLPMPGIIIAFKNYNFRDGIFKSPWAGLDNFKFFFGTDDFTRTTFNTLFINFNIILWGTVLAIIFAIFLNEIRNQGLKRVLQIFMFLPYFFSAVIVGKFVYLIFNIDQGVANQIVTIFGSEPIQWYLDPKYWVKIIVGSSLWKNVGYSVIIYLATITGIDSQLYEASEIDGANRFQQITRILFPHLVPTIATLTLLAIGRIFFGDFQLIYAITENNGQLIPTTDIIETYIYRTITGSSGAGIGEFGFTGAVGLYQSLVGFILVLGSNLLVKKYNKEYSLF